MPPGDFPCARCGNPHGHYVGDRCPLEFYGVPAGVGCICPPGANLQCQNPICPRKALDMRPTS